ncbi:MAG: ABC transporter permease [Candidatus Omnitrophica bacterium]|nr:ABC transporter permease [Candidatus Omnitrophota bacterium]
MDKYILGSAGEKLKKIYNFRRALWGMGLKQFKAGYAGSFLGVFWVAVNPVLIMLAITFVFTAVFKAEIKDFGFFVLAGILPWMFFSGTLCEASPSLLTQRGVLHQFGLPKEVLPLGVVLSHFMNFLVSWCIVCPIFIIRSPKTIPLFIYLPALFLLTLVFTSGMAVLFSVINILFRDLEQLIGTVLMFWFWVTPVFYTIGMVPGKFRWVFDLNPFSSFVVCYQDIFFWAKAPDPGMLCKAALWSIFSLFCGMLVSVKCENEVLKRI